MNGGEIYPHYLKIMSKMFIKFFLSLGSHGAGNINYESIGVSQLYNFLGMTKDLTYNGNDGIIPVAVP